MEPRDSKDFELQDELRAFSESVSNDLYLGERRWWPQTRVGRWAYLLLTPRIDGRCIPSEHFDVAFYLEDAIQQLILSPPKSESPLKALASYFDRCERARRLLMVSALTCEHGHHSVVDGSNVIRRSFKYVHATVLNRKAFVRHVLHALQPVVTPGTARDVRCRYTPSTIAYLHLTCVCIGMGPVGPRHLHGEGHFADGRPPL